MLLEVPYTLLWWVVAPYGCDIGILLGCTSMMRMPDRADR